MVACVQCRGRLVGLQARPWYLQFRRWVVGALSSYSTRAGVPLTWVPRWSPHPSVHTCGLGVGPPKGVPVTPITSVLT